MIPFYTELKTLRKRQEVELTEIANRTKINVRFLEALEAGDFSFLPNVYVRLFLKAYSLEIGADAEDTLNQLEIFLANSESRPPPARQVILDKGLTQKEDEESEEVEVSGRPPFQMRASAIKVVALLAVVFFAVYVIRQIATEESSEVPVPTTATSGEMPARHRITDQFLDMNYTSRTRTEELLLASPFSFTLKAKVPIWYEFSVDYTEPVSETLLAGGEIAMDFRSYFHLRVDRSSGISFMINDSVVSVDSTSHPVDLAYQAQDGLLTTTDYLPR